MYESFFGLRHRPFLAVPAPDLYVPTPPVEAARAALARSIERDEGLGVVVGPAGTGKSLLCHLLAEQFRGVCQVALLGSGRLATRRALLQAMLFSLGLPYRGMEEGELRLALVDHLSSERSGDGMLLLLDEAHVLPLRLLEEVRLISNLVRGGRPRVRVVLAGAPILEERFGSPRLESFNQRITARGYLRALERGETADFVRGQLLNAGGRPEELFALEAFENIHRASDGIPRLINQLCDHALLLAYAGGQRRIDAAGIQEAWSDLQQLPTPRSDDRSRAVGGDALIEFGGLDDGPPRRPSSAAPNAVGRTSIAPAAAESVDPRHLVEDDESTYEDDFRPTGAIAPEVEFVFHEPRTHPTDSLPEEEIIVDRYAELDATTSTRAGSRSAYALTPPESPTGEWGAVSSTSSVSDQGAGVVRAASSGNPTPPRQSGAERSTNQAFRQLFSKLRST